MNGRGVILGGGMGKGLYAVTLPRSKYYGDVAEWVTTSAVDPMASPSLQIVCNGELWCVAQDGIYCRSLATKEVTKHKEGTYYLYGGSNRTLCGIATDGENLIWFTSFSEDVTSKTMACSVNLYEYNILTDTIRSFEVCSANTSGTSPTWAAGTLAYSSKYERVYWFGLGRAESAGYNGYLDLKTYETTSFETEYTWGDGASKGISGCYVYEDEDGYIYIGDGFSGLGTTGVDTNFKYNPCIYRFNPYDNTLTTIRTDFDDQMNSVVSDKAYFTIGETMYIMNATNVAAINPKTGEFIEGEMPLVLGDALDPGKKAIYNNTVYIWQDVTDKTLVECTFYADSPPNAPIVAKIYKGQKFHTLVPFKLLRQNIEVTTVQQKATEDIEIKMYDYSAEGGQILYIET